MNLEGPDTGRTWLDRLLSGEDAGAWDELVRVYSGPLLRLFKKLGAKPHDDEALCGEVFKSVARRLKTNTYDKSKGQFRGYLYRIAERAYGKYSERLARLPTTGLEGAVLDGGGKFVRDGVAEPADHVEGLHLKWFFEEVVNSAVRRSLDEAKAHFPVRTYKAFEITSVTVEPGPDGDMYRIDTGYADPALLQQAAAECQWPVDRVSKEKSRVKVWVLARLRDLVPEEV